MKKQLSMFAGIGGHQSNRSMTVEYLTPKNIIDALGPFDLDPCTPIEQPWPTASRKFSFLDDGLRQPWRGRVWLNPPYDDVEPWLERLADHGCGTALIFARTETAAFHRQVWRRAHALFFYEGRLTFRVGEAYSVVKTRKTYQVGDPAPGNAGAPNVLCAYGAADADVLSSLSIPGTFVPLRVGAAEIVSLFVPDGAEQTWGQVIATIAPTQGHFTVDDLYRVARLHPKAKANRHVREKIRQQLQRGPFAPVARGIWRRAA